MTPFLSTDLLTLYNGDALEVLPLLTPGLCSAFVSDPPYTMAGGSSNGRGARYEDQFYLHWLKSVADGLRRVVKPDGAGFLFCDWRTVHCVQDAMQDVVHLRGRQWALRQVLVWDREHFGMGSPFRNGFELIAFASGPSWKNPGIPKNISTVVRFRHIYGNQKDKASKPEGLLKMLIKWLAPNGAVLDPFAGSGPVGRVCIELGIPCVLIEKDERACEAIAKRLDQQRLCF